MRWHYQWLVVHEFLPGPVGQAAGRGRLCNGRKHYIWRNDPFIPVEFSVAAYRFGHSQVRPSYRANFGTDAKDPAKQFFAFIFDPSRRPGRPGRPAGRRRAPRRFIDWQTFFDFGDGNVRHNKKIDTKLSTPLFDAAWARPTSEPHVAGTRNLLRSLTMKVPSGQRVAKAMRLPVLSHEDLDDLERFDLDTRTPLWFYVLKEAEVMADGEHLGPVGGRIVAEVIIGLIRATASPTCARSTTGRPRTAPTTRSPPWIC